MNAGKWISTGESQVADWYHSVMTIGPEPKQILLFIPSVSLFARVYSGKGDEDINVQNERTYHDQTQNGPPVQYYAPQSSKHEVCYLIIDWVMCCVRSVENGHREGHPP